MLALWTLALAGFAMSGLSNANGSRCFYVLPFYLFLPFPLFYWMMGIIKLWRSPPRFNEIDKDEGYNRIHESTLGAAILGGLHTVGEAVFMLQGGAGSRLIPELQSLGAVFMLGFCALYTHRVLMPLKPQLQGKQPEPASAS